MPDNVALLEKNNDLLNGSSAESQEDCGCSFKKAPTQETVSNPQNVQSIVNFGGNDTLESSVTQDPLNANTGNEFLPSSTANIRRSSSQVGGGSLSSDGSAYILTEGSDTFTIPLGLLDTLVGGLRGLGGADSITGSESADIVYGDEGDDRIEGLGGADLFYGGPGNDFLSGGAGQNGLLGGDGADTLQGGESADGVNGNRGDDVIFGGGGNDFLRGGRGNDIVNGEDGDDLVIGDFGNDTLTGGAGQDVFFLRYEAALGSPTFDLITDFQRTIDFIGLSTNLRESDVILESKVQPSGGSAVDIKVAATGTLLGTVLGVTPEDLKGRFRPYDVEGERPEDVATIDLPEVTKLSENRFQMEFPASDGSKYTIVFQDDADGRFVESVIFVPNPTTGVRGSTTLFNRDGTQADITLEGSNETLRVESRQNAENGNQEEGVISGIKDGQIFDTVTFPLPIEPTVPPNPEPPVTPPTVGESDFAKACKSVEEFCKGTAKLAKVVDFAAAASAVGGLVLPPLEIVAGAMGAASIGFKVIDYSCKLLTGSDKDLGDAVIGEVSGIGVGKIIKSGELTGDLAEGTGDVLDLASSSNELIDSFFGQEKPTEPSKTNFLPQFRKFLADKTGIPFDFCDKPATTPEPAPTCSEQVFKAEVIPSVLNYGQTAEVKVTYCDPQNKLNNILVELDTRSGKQTKNIPISSPSGTVSFEIRNKSNAFGDCDDLGFAATGRPGISGSVVITGIRDNANGFASFGALPDFFLTGGLTQIPTQFDSRAVCGVELV
ncbi:calcium-binding protein [Planktothrix agardhii]|uniref:calcium-binding protein n=1 Tax=Planktothrix agardhii TaxID=1160 RepID=UPI0020A7BDAA|nr:calcium-binding protein [Planktothrix agardhii]CAD5960354.1 Leukotoxin [Planktothrix agardhii]